jgi:hypothetical protein
MTTTEVSNGLVLPYAAITIAGKGGAAAVLLITFMACTKSSGENSEENHTEVASADQIAVCGLLLEVLAVHIEAI